MDTQNPVEVDVVVDLVGADVVLFEVAFRGERSSV